MIYFEYSSWIVKNGKAPAELCCTERKSIQDPFKGNLQMANLAERIFEVKGNNVVELKNRYGNFKKSYISNEEKVVLVLKAVLI